MSGYFEQITCPICKKKFFPSPQHVYKDQRGNLVCSWHCSNASYLEFQKSKQEKRARAEQRRAEYEETKYARKKQKATEGKREKKECELQSKCKPVIVCAKDGTILKRYPSVTEAARATGYASTTVSHICRGTKRATGQYTFRYEREEDITPRKSRIKENKGARKPVFQFTEDGNFVARHETVSDAAKAVNSSSSSISKCCHNITKSVKGFAFMFESEFNKYDKKKG